MYQKKAALINQFLTLWKQLKEETIITNQKDFTSQIGEWLIAELFNGKLAENGKQKDWDLIANNLKYQVKGHAKSTSSKRRDTDFNYNIDSDLDVFVIVVFNEIFELQNIFQVSKSEIFQKKLVTERKSGKNVISWSNLVEHDILNSYQWNEKQKEILSIFGNKKTSNKLEGHTFKIKIGNPWSIMEICGGQKHSLSFLPLEGAEIILKPRNKKEILCKLVNNPNKRILSNVELKDYIQKNFKIGDFLEFEMVNTNEMKILN